MKTYTKEDVLKQYEESCRIMYEATEIGDYKTNNKEGKKLIKIFKYFENNREFAMECINEMLCHEHVLVRTKAAAYCLALKENVEAGERVLEEISQEKSFGIYRFNAEMTLKVWREQGYLKLY